MTKVFLEQIKTAGAGEGDSWVYNAAQGLWALGSPLGVFFAEFNHISNTVQITTTSATFQQALRLSVTVPSGNYIVMWTLAGGDGVSGGAGGAEFQVQLDDTTTLWTSRIAMQTRPGHGSFKRLALNGSHNIDLDYRSLAGATARIQHRSLILFRES